MNFRKELEKTLYLIVDIVDKVEKRLQTTNG